MSLFGLGPDNAGAEQQQGLERGYENASKFYRMGRSELEKYYGAAMQPFGQMFNQASQGVNAYGNAMGLNGAAGSRQAYNAFSNTPGYQFALGQGLQSIDRGAASRGMLSSGNTAVAEQHYGTGLADQTYQSYVKNLSPYFAQQQAGASGLGTINMGLGNALNTSLANQGNLNYNTQVGIGNSQAANTVGNQNTQMSFLSGLGSLGSQLFGYMGGPSGISNIFSGSSQSPYSNVNGYSAGGIT